jgi:IS5 family transposase
MNGGKEGKPFKLTHTYMHFLAVVRYLYGMPYRQLEGFTRALEGLVGLPSGDYTTLRKRMLLLDMRLFADPVRRRSKGKGKAVGEKEREPLAIALDSTGVRVQKAGGWMERVHGVKKKCLKVHFAVNVRTKEVVAMEVTTDEVHDSRVAEKLVEKTEANAGPVKEVLGDGAYDSARIYDRLRERGIDAAIKPRKNSVLETRSEARRQEVDLYRCLGHEKWAEEKGYGRRWSVETAYSTFKRTFGEAVMAKTMANAMRELVAKASIYNMLVRM